MPPITMQQLIDAGIDAESLSGVVNGPDSAIVTTRLGRTIKTLARVIKELSEQDIGEGAAALINQRINDAGIPAAPLSLDWDAIAKTGFYRSGNAGGTVGTPVPIANLLVLHTQHSTGSTLASQLAFRNNDASPQTWRRGRGTAGLWGPWVELRTDANTGQFAKVAPTVTDWDSISESGFYRGSGNTGETVGAPSTNAYLTMMHVQGQLNAAFQIASQSTSSEGGKKWMRSRGATGDGIWGPWVEIGGNGIGAIVDTIKGQDPGASVLRDSSVTILRQESALYGQMSSAIYTSANDIYAHYDQLITDFPDYVSKTLLGQDNFGNDIFEYVFAAPKIRGSGQSAVNKAHPKIVVTSAVHPDERVALVGTMAFFDDLCRYWQQDNKLSQLRWGATIVLMPVCCPSGVNAGTRVNGAGVNIGRNLSWEWENNEAPDRGPSPLSEPESNYIAGLPSRHPDACLFIDNHGHAGEHLTWIGARLEKSFIVAKHCARLLENEFRRTLLPTAYTNNSLAAVTTTAIGGPPSEWAMIDGKNALLIEHAENRAWAGINLRDSQRAVSFAMREVFYESWLRESETRGYVEAPDWL